ncbi:MAG: Peptide methionine sulfoxide reductase MsrB [Methanomassiliicoccales archaeon PtaU1.Bin124]|nr:MAG: Peptide methionine sulfoxide reductase MsrB [Methanomassiliicoccales archaeon PtaU1.Bin124]
MEKIVKSDEEWRKELTPDQYRLLRQKGTEPAFHNEYWDNKHDGTYLCAGCGSALFSSDKKFDSGTGWPSFWDPVSPDAVETETDRSFGMVRTEVKCARCGGHLGHLFKDSPTPNGMRYCMNSGALKFRQKK